MKFSACTSGYSHGQKKVDLQSTLPRTLMENCSFRRGSSWTLALALRCMCIKNHAKIDLVHFTDHVDVRLFFFYHSPALALRCTCIKNHAKIDLVSEMELSHSVVPISRFFLTFIKGTTYYHHAQASRVAGGFGPPPDEFR